ncbi:MAG: lipopolysaccharide heptosyltransferase II [Acidobacteria bacterium]|nr:lipopolysaccharide heptosyltransferase II [Acidobacteriota bacterium]
MNRILVIQTAFLGDVVLTTPLLRELRRAQPAAELVVVSTPLGVQTLTGLRHVGRLLAFEKKGVQRGVLGMGRFARDLRRERFDAVVAAQRSSRTALLALASGAPVRVGFAGAPGSWSYTREVRWDRAHHAVRRYLALSGPLGGDPESADPTPELAVLDDARAEVLHLLGEAGVPAGAQLVGIAPGSIWGTKRWLPERYAELARALREDGARPLLLGSPAERELCERIAAQAGDVAPVLAGRTSVPQLTALLSLCAALVTNDSGPGHVASAVGTPVVAVFGPTVPAFGYTPFGPRNAVVEQLGLACRPCDSHGPQVCPLGHHRCMTEIPVSAVLAATRCVLAVA